MSRLVAVILYGFSNNPRLFKRPGFRQIAFDLPEQGTTIRVRMR